MHRSLLISEVVVKICQELAYPCHGILFFGSLAGFATTCRAISEPALDVLWHEQSSLAPLLRCMPSDLWEARVVANGQTCLYLRRPIVSTDWNRLLTYAHRIKVFGTANFDPRKEFSSHVSAEAFRSLSSSKPMPSAPLCPNIRSLEWDVLSSDDNEIFPHIRLFLGPSTKCLALSLSGADFSRISIILSLPRDCPGLTDIGFYSDGDDEVWCDAISDTVCQWNRLESVTWLDDFSCRALIHLAGLSTLHRIDISIPDFSAPDWQKYHSALQGDGFQALASAIFHSKDITSCTSLIDKTSLRQLRSIFIDFYQGLNQAADVGHFFRTLNARCSHTTLTKFEVGPCFSRYPHPLGVVDEDLFRPLLEFHNMTYFHVEFPLAFRLGNRTLNDIAASWKHLQSLHIGTRGGWAGQSRISLGGLVPLLSLPKLQRLGIVINASVVEHTLDLPPTGVCNTKIFRLDLADSVIQNEHSVAAFLSDVLPNVKRIDSWHDDAAYNASVSLAEAKKYKNRWNIVAGLIETFAKVREQERRCVGKATQGDGSTPSTSNGHIP